MLANFFSANMADTQIDGDAVQPSAKTGAEFEVFQRSESPNESFLGDVGGLVMVSQHAKGDAVDSLLVKDHESVEGPLLAPQEFLDQFILFGYFIDAQ
jgi:hypothetical protein